MEDWIKLSKKSSR